MDVDQVFCGTPAGGDNASHRRFERTRAAPDNAAHFFETRTTQQGASFSFLNGSMCAPCAVRSGFYFAHNLAGRGFLFYAWIAERALRGALG